MAHLYTPEAIVEEVRKLGNPEAIAGMARFGIASGKAYGVSIPNLRAMAKKIGRNHELALQLWSIDWRETRILAAMVGDPEQVDGALMESWVLDFYDWEVCDQCCMNLFEKNPLAWKKAVEWSHRGEEFVKRAGFVLMARLAVSDKKAADEAFETFFTHIEREAGDSRNFVKKAVNWALRQIGKRNRRLNQKALASAQRIQSQDSRSARWVAADAIRELGGEAVQSRLKGQAGRPTHRRQHEADSTQRIDLL